MKNQIEKIKMSKEEFDTLYEVEEPTQPDASSSVVEEEKEVDDFLSEEEQEIDNLLDAIPDGADIT